MGAAAAAAAEVAREKVERELGFLGGAGFGCFVCLGNGGLRATLIDGWVDYGMNLWLTNASFVEVSYGFLERASLMMVFFF